MFDLQPFSIGPIKVALPAILAPMAGYTDLAYRRICRQLGADYCVTEMMLAKLLCQSGKLRNRLIRLADDDHPVAGQLLGNDPAEMARAAGVLGQMGFDVVDLNFGCPVRKALKRHRGGFLMSQPDQAVEITRAVIAAVDIPVTVKLRMKFNDVDSEDAFWQIAEESFDAGVAAVIIHARSVETRYSGPADWGFLKRVADRFQGKTIIGSGDVLKPADAIDMLARTGVAAAAVARGALGNPWFFRQVKDLAADRQPYQPSLSDQAQLLVNHMAGAVDLYGPARAPRIMRKFGIKYARMHPQTRQVRAAFVGIKRPQNWQEVLDKFYSVDTEE